MGTQVASQKIALALSRWIFPKIGVYTPKWMVYNGKPYEQMDDLGGFPPIFVQHPDFPGRWELLDSHRLKHPQLEKLRLLVVNISSLGGFSWWGWKNAWIPIT